MANEKYAPLLEYLSENEEKKHRTGTCKDTKMALLDHIREKSFICRRGEMSDGMLPHFGGIFFVKIESLHITNI